MPLMRSSRSAMDSPPLPQHTAMCDPNSSADENPDLLHMTHFNVLSINDGVAVDVAVMED
eukprot:9529569-Prorocentrum_lima.AAC.1